MVLDNNCTRVLADDPQSRLLRDTRASDGGFQSAVAPRVTAHHQLVPRATNFIGRNSFLIGAF